MPKVIPCQLCLIAKKCGLVSISAPKSNTIYLRGSLCEEPLAIMPTKTKEQLEAEYDAMYADTDDEVEQADVVKKGLRTMMRNMRNPRRRKGGEKRRMVLHRRRRGNQERKQEPKKELLREKRQNKKIREEQAIKEQKAESKKDAAAQAERARLKYLPPEYIILSFWKVWKKD